MTATLTRQHSVIDPAPAPRAPGLVPPARLAPASHPAAPLSAAERVRRWGRSSVSPFLLGADREVHELPAGGVMGFVRRGGWAVMATDPVGPPVARRRVIPDAIELVRALRLRPVVVASEEPAAYRALGLWSTPIADDALVDLRSFTLAGGRMANLRHSVAAGRRAGLEVAPWHPAMRDAAAAVSAQWLATKRGGEMGFTLGRFDPDALDDVDCRVALDQDGTVLALVTWHSYDDGRARVLDLMRRAPSAPGPTMDLLIAESLIELAQRGVEVASLGSVPRSHGAAAERIYPTRSLRRYKEKFAPTWEPRHLVVPQRHQVPRALLAVGRAYSPDGVLAACRRNSSAA